MIKPPKKIADQQALLVIVGRCICGGTRCEQGKAENKHLHTGGDDEERLRLGLSNKCYSDFYVGLQRTPLDSRDEYIDRCVRKGLILAHGRQHEIKTNNPFANI